MTMKECLRLFQSTKPIRPLSFNILEVKPFIVHSFIGTSVDYLIRYAAMGNRLILAKTVAHLGWGIGACGSLNGLWEDDIQDERVMCLYQIGEQYLDGRDATDSEAIYSAIALSILEKIFRSGSLPRLFIESLTEKETKALLDEYMEQMGGKGLIQDISDCLKTYLTALQDPESEIFNSKIVVFNRALGNSELSMPHKVKLHR